MTLTHNSQLVTLSEMHRKYRYGECKERRGGGRRKGRRGKEGGNNYKEERLMCALMPPFSPNEFRLKWVDDTHALGIFAGSRQGEICY